MSTKKEYTIEELETQYKQVEENREALAKLITQKKQEEKERKEKELALKKETRRKEVDDAIANCKALLKAYMHDYGIYSYTSSDDDDTIFNSRFWNWVW